MAVKVIRKFRLLHDVTFGSPNDGDVVTYDEGTDKFTLAPPAGGGGSLPDWWTVDSTPGSERVEFAGVVKWQPSDPTGQALLGGPAQVGQINADAPDQIAFDIYGFTGTGDILRLSDGEFNIVHEVGPTGVVTVITPDDENTVFSATTRDAGTGIEVHGEGDPGKPTLWVFGSFNNPTQPLLFLDDTVDGNTVVEIGPKGAVKISPNDATGTDGALLVKAGPAADYAYAFKVDDPTTPGGGYAPFWVDGAGEVQIIPQETGAVPLSIRGVLSADEVLKVNSSGVTTIRPNEDGVALRLVPRPGWAGLQVFETDFSNPVFSVDGEGNLWLKDVNSHTTFNVGPTGDVAISPSATDLVALTVVGADGATERLLSIEDFEGDNGMSLFPDGRFFLFGIDGSNQFQKTAAGAVIIDPGGDVNPLHLFAFPDGTAEMFTVSGEQNSEGKDTFTVFSHGGFAARVWDGATGLMELDDKDGNSVFMVGVAGKVDIEPSDATLTTAVRIKHADIGSGRNILQLRDGANVATLTANNLGSLAVNLLDDAAEFSVVRNAGPPIIEVVGGSAIGLFGATPVTQPAEPTTLNEMIAAAQALGLVAA